MYPIGTAVRYHNLSFRIVNIYRLEDGRIVYELERSLGFITPNSNVFALPKFCQLDLNRSHNIRIYQEEEDDETSTN